MYLKHNISETGLGLHLGVVAVAQRQKLVLSVGPN
jgi:hypothetical protein